MTTTYITNWWLQLYIFFHTDFSSIHFLCNAYFSTAGNKYHPIDWCQFIVIFSKIISNCPGCISITGIYLHFVNGTCFKKRFHAFFFRQTGHVDDWVNIPNVLFIQYINTIGLMKKMHEIIFINKFIINVQINSYNIYVKL